MMGVSNSVNSFLARSGNNPVRVPFLLSRLALRRRLLPPHHPNPYLSTLGAKTFVRSRRGGVERIDRSRGQERTAGVEGRGKGEGPRSEERADEGEESKHMVQNWRPCECDAEMFVHCARASQTPMAPAVGFVSTFFARSWPWMATFASSHANLLKGSR